MIGLGLGIDYALLTVSRFRESLASGQGTGPAAEEAAARAGWTILLSAFPVSIGFAALLTIPLSELRSVGLAGLLVTLFSFLLSVTLLPAVLSLLGPRIDALRVFAGPSGQGRRRLGGLAAMGKSRHLAPAARPDAHERAAPPARAQARTARHGDAARRLAAAGLGVRRRVPPARRDGPLQRHALAAGRARLSRGRDAREPGRLGRRERASTSG